MQWLQGPPLGPPAGPCFLSDFTKFQLSWSPAKDEHETEDDDGDEAGSTSSWEAGGSIHPDSMIMKHSEEWE